MKKKKNNNDKLHIYAVCCCILVVAFSASNVLLALRGPNWDFVDESIYIPAAAAILDGHSCPNANAVLPIETVCNYEHPPLVKILEAISLYTFGRLVPNSSYINPSYREPYGNASSSLFWFLAFRFFQLVMGALSIALIYIIAHKISGNKRLALLASALLSLEPLYAFFSRTAYLDIPMIFFALSAYATYFARYRPPITTTTSTTSPPLDDLDDHNNHNNHNDYSYWLTGILLGLSTLSKETGIVFTAPLIIYHLIFTTTTNSTTSSSSDNNNNSNSGRWRHKTSEILTMIAAQAITTAAGLQLYDTLTMAPFPTFADQIVYMFAYSKALSCTLLCHLGNGPFAWFVPFLPASWTQGLSWNHALTWLAFVWLAVGIHSIAKKKKDDSNSSSSGIIIISSSGGGPGGDIDAEDRLFVFAALLFASTLTEDILLFASGRISWIWYMLTIVPSLALGGAYLLTRREIAFPLRALVLGLLVVGFVAAYAMGPALLSFD